MGAPSSAAAGTLAAPSQADLAVVIVVTTIVAIAFTESDVSTIANHDVHHHIFGLSLADVQQLALGESSSSLHSDAWNALDALDEGVHIKLVHEVVRLRVVAPNNHQHHHHHRHRELTHLEFGADPAARSQLVDPCTVR